MSMGLPDDPRQFPRMRKSDRVITKDISTNIEKPKKCYWCKQVIVGKIWRVDSKRVECTQCHNEGTTSPLEGDFLNQDFNIDDFY